MPKKKQSKEDVIDDAELKRDRARVPDFLLDKFGSFGFVKWTSAYCPVLIVDPMELIRRKVLPKGIYHAWMYRIDLNLEDDNEKVSALIYWYGTTYEFSVVALEDVTSFEKGKELGYDKIPDFMKRRMEMEMPVPAVHQLVKDGMAELEATSLNIPPNERSSIIVNPKRKRQVVLNEWHALSMEPKSEEQESWEEQKSLLLDVGLPNSDSFGTIGFLPFKMKGDNANGKNPSLSSSSSSLSSSSSSNNSNFKHIHPVMVLSPFKIPPGPIRKEWFHKCSSKQMVMVYWFGAYICGRPQAAYSFAYLSQITSWEDGIKLGYDKLPPHILQEYENGTKPSRGSTVAATTATSKKGKKKGRPPKNKKGGSASSNSKTQTNMMVDWLVCGHWEMKDTMERYPTPSERWGGIEDFEETYVDDFDYYYDCIEAAQLATQEKERISKEEGGDKQQQQQQQGGGDDDDDTKKKDSAKKQKQQPQKEKPQKEEPNKPKPKQKDEPKKPKPKQKEEPKKQKPQQKEQPEQQPQKEQPEQQPQKEQPKQDKEEKNLNVESPRDFNEDGRPPPPRPANTQKPKRKNSIPRKTSNLDDPPKDQHPFAAAAMSSFKSKLKGGGNNKSKPDHKIARHVNGFVDKGRSRKSLTKTNKKLKIKKKRKRSDSSIDGYSDDSLRSGSMNGRKDLKRRSNGDFNDDPIRKKSKKERPPEIINGSDESRNEKSSGSMGIFRIPRKGDKPQNIKEERSDDKNSNAMKMEVDEVNIKKNDDIAPNTNVVKKEEHGGIFDDPEEKVSYDVASSEVSSSAKDGKVSSKPTLNDVNTKNEGREAQEIGNVRISKSSVNSATANGSLPSHSTPPPKTLKSKSSIHAGLPNELFSPEVGPRKRASLTVNAHVANKAGDTSLRQHLANANYALDGGVSPFKVSSVSNDDVGGCSPGNSSNDSSLDEDVHNSLLNCAAALKGNASAKTETNNNQKNSDKSKKRRIDQSNEKSSILI